MQGRTLFIHAGIHKTGTSYIQSCLKNSREALLAVCLNYGPGDDFNIEEDSRVSSGNALTLIRKNRSNNKEFKCKDEIKNKLSEIDSNNKCNLVISSEGLLIDLGCSGAIHDFISAANSLGFDKISIKYFVRNPIGHATSVWQQLVKQNGEIRTMDEWIHEYNYYFSVEKAVQTLDAFDAITLSASNYSKTKTTLINEIEAWLVIGNGVIQPVSAASVNRSLTRAERALQIELNKRFGRSAKIIALPLIEQLPNQHVEKIAPSVRVQQETWERLSHVIGRLNTRIDKDHRITFDSIDIPEEDGPIIFSGEQLSVIASGFHEYCQMQVTRANRLEDALGSARDLLKRTGAFGQQADVLKRHDSRLNYIFANPWKTYVASVNYRLHKSLSKWRILPLGMRERLAKAARKRRENAIYGSDLPHPMFPRLPQAPSPRDDP